MRTAVAPPLRATVHACGPLSCSGKRSTTRSRHAAPPARAAGLLRTGAGGARHPCHACQQGQRRQRRVAVVRRVRGRGAPDRSRPRQAAHAHPQGRRAAVRPPTPPQLDCPGAFSDRQCLRLHSELAPSVLEELFEDEICDPDLFKSYVLAMHSVDQGDADKGGAQRLQGPGVSWSQGLSPPPPDALVAQLGRRINQRLATRCSDIADHVGGDAIFGMFRYVAERGKEHEEQLCPPNSVRFLRSSKLAPVFRPSFDHILGRIWAGDGAEGQHALRSRGPLQCRERVRPRAVQVGAWGLCE